MIAVLIIRSPLNSDYKILAKILAKCPETPLPLIISPDQTGFIKNRYSFFNTRRLFNIFYAPSSEQADNPEAVISLDAQKAFDRIERDYLISALGRFGFGRNFIKWVSILYLSPTATVRTNSTSSAPFLLQRGTRQGCPLSPILFAIAIEPVAISFRSNINIRGISRYGREQKVTLYANDLLVFVSSADSSIPQMLSNLNKFGVISGYKLNLSKSELFPVNKATLQTSWNSSLEFLMTSLPI